MVAFTLADAVPTLSFSGLTNLTTKRVIAGCGLVVGIVLLVYLAVFLTFDWVVWRGMGDFVAYHQRVIQHNLELPSRFPNASPFWSWPLLLHPYPYWKEDTLNGTSQGFMVRRKSANLVGHPTRDYHSIRSRVYAEKHSLDVSGRRIPDVSGDVDPAAPLRLHLQLHAGVVFRPAGFGGCPRRVLERRRTTLGTVSADSAASTMSDSRLGSCLGWTRSCPISIAYLLLMRRFKGWDGKFVCLIFMSATVLIFAYFLPLWMDTPLSETSYNASECG